MIVPAQDYDELPYRSFPIECTAPERLALTSRLHGGPRTRVHGYRMLELGCGDGTNLLALAYHRRHGEFVGIDGSSRHVEAALARARTLGLDNLRFVHADLRAAAAELDGDFDYVVAHGVISWVPDDVREAVLGLHRTRLRSDGLVYLNYNAQPGWSVRGLVRRLLREQTAGIAGLLGRARAAQQIASRLGARLAASEHAWSQLMAMELGLVAAGEPSYVAHEYLATENRCYWRSEFLALARAHGLELVADADFDRPSGRGLPELDAWLTAEALGGGSLDDASDLMRYRQMHSPIFAAQPWVHHPMTAAELGTLMIASSLIPGSDPSALPISFGDADGREIEICDATLRDALLLLLPQWPRGARVDDLLPRDEALVADLLQLHRLGMLELRCVEPGDFGVDAAALHALEARERGEVTTAYHRREARPGSSS
jgi:SAM-dependent methyltransferase